MAYLQSGPSGYMNACLRALTDADASLFITLPPRSRDAPYAQASVPADVVYGLETFDRDPRLESALREFDPDVLVIVSWHHAAYRSCARHLHRPLRVLCMDNQWLATPKQRLGVLTRSLHVQPYFDVAFVPGRRQRDFAQRLGFAEDRIFSGYYSADTELFQAGRHLDHDDRAAFLFVGRLAPEKGIETLIAAYTEYRNAVENPWDLVVAGTGPLADELESVPGVRMIGFVQPEELPGVFDLGRFLVLPSRFEPWGVVVHEATASGLGVICSSRVGAGDDLVEDRGNGRIVDPGNVPALTDALRWAHALTSDELRAVASTSIELARPFSPSRWADTVLDIGGRFRRCG